MKTTYTWCTCFTLPQLQNVHCQHSGEPATSVFGIKQQEEYKEVVWVLDDGRQDYVTGLGLHLLLLELLSMTGFVFHAEDAKNTIQTLVVLTVQQR